MRVIGDSMSPLIENNSILLLKSTNQQTLFNRGDIIVFNSIFNLEKNIIKRIIGLPFEKIKIENDGKIYVNDQLISESNIYSGGERGFYWELGENEFIVLGDNRNNTFDSRKFGKINVKNIFWRVLICLKPFRKIPHYEYL